MLMGLALPTASVVQLVALVMVLDTMAINLNQLLHESSDINTNLLVLIQIFSFLTMILGTYFIGKLFGGTGSFIHTIMMLCWLNLIVVLFQFLQVLVSAVVTFLPALGFIGVSIQSLVTGFSLFLFFWLYVHFVKVVHSFHSALKVFGGLLLSILVIAFAVMGLFNLLMI